MPDLKLYRLRPQITVVFEESYTKLQTPHIKAQLAASKYTREETCCIVHSVPRHRILETVKWMKEIAGFVFVTDRVSRYYEGFGDGWEEFVRAMAKD